MSNSKIGARKKEIKDNGDIVIDNFKFPKTAWCRLVPKIISEFENITGHFFIDDTWKHIVNCNYDIKVMKKLRESECVGKDDLMHYDFSVNVGGRKFTNKTMTMRGAITPKHIEKLSALVLISLHGLGECGGSVCVVVIAILISDSL